MNMGNPRLHRLIAIVAITMSFLMLGAASQAAGDPFAANFTCTSLFTDLCEGTYTAPTDHRLVIEYLSFNCPASKTPTFGQFVIHSTGAGVTGYTAGPRPKNPGGASARLAKP